MTIHLWRSYRVARIVFDGSQFAVGRRSAPRRPVLRTRPLQSDLAVGRRVGPRAQARDRGLLPRLRRARGDVRCGDVHGRGGLPDRGGRARPRCVMPFFDGKIEPFTADQLLAGAKLKVGSAYRESKARDGRRAAAEVPAAAGSIQGGSRAHRGRADRGRRRHPARLPADRRAVVRHRGVRDQAEAGAQGDPRPARRAGLRRGPPRAVGGRDAGGAAALRALPGEGDGRGGRHGSGHREGDGRGRGQVFRREARPGRAMARSPTRRCGRSWSRGRAGCR